MYSESWWSQSNLKPKLVKKVRFLLIMGSVLLYFCSASHIQPFQLDLAHCRIQFYSRSNPKNWGIFALERTFIFYPRAKLTLLIKRQIRNTAHLAQPTRVYMPRFSKEYNAQSSLALLIL